MSETKSPAVHIDRRHQSAPSETEADKAVRLAAQEIDEGHWQLTREQQVEMGEVPGIALRDGLTPDVKPWSQEDFDRTDESLVLGQHPRVMEALAKQPLYAIGNFNLEWKIAAATGQPSILTGAIITLEKP